MHLTQTTKNTFKKELEDYLSAKGINVSKKFHCLNPEHTDKNPSMSFDRNRNRIHCFACGVDYDIFDVIRIDYGLDEKDVFKKAAEIFNFTSYRQKPQESDYSEFFKEAHRHIGETDYIAERGLSVAVAQRFMLGYKKSTGDTLRRRITHV